MVEQASYCFNPTPDSSYILERIYEVLFQIILVIALIIHAITAIINCTTNNCYNPFMIRNNLSEIMGRKRINCAELSRLCEVSYETINKLYHEKKKGIEFKTLDKLCWALQCTPSEIFEYIETT